MVCKKCGSNLPENALYCMFCGRAVNYTPTKKKRGNGQGTAFKRGNTWTGKAPGYDYTDQDGVYHRIRPTKGGFATKREALQWASGDSAKNSPPPKLIELWKAYSDNDMLKLSKSKQTAYKIARKRLESLMSKRIDEIELNDIQDVVNAECKSYYPAKDVKDLLSNLYKRAMASNTNRGRITQNLSKFIVLPPLEEDEAIPFTQEEVGKLWGAFDRGDIVAAYILLMCYTGMMPGELLKCKVDMVDIDALEIRGAGAKTKKRMKSAIAFPDFVKPVVEATIASRSTNPIADNTRLVYMDRVDFYSAFYDTLDKAGIKNSDHRLTPYSCRHTFGTEAVKAGFSPAIVQQMMRHSSTRMQERYTHLASSDVHEAVNAIPKAKSADAAESKDSKETSAEEDRKSNKTMKATEYRRMMKSKAK